MSSTAEIKAADVQKLRQVTGAGLMDCKRALVETGNDFDKATKLLREKGIAKSSKRADRTAGEGLVLDWVATNQKEGILFEMNSETDFVARNEEFVSLAQNYLKQIQDNPSWTEANQLPQEPLLELSGKIGEKLEIRRFARFKTDQGIIATYIHTGSKLGVMVQLNTNKPAESLASVNELAKEICLQIASTSPTYIDQTGVPAEIINQEKEITKKQMEGQKKPAEILEKIAIGKLSQFYAAHCLLEQAHVRDSSGKSTVKSLVDDVAKKESIEIKIAKFVRFRVGAE